MQRQRQLAPRSSIGTLAAAMQVRTCNRRPPTPLAQTTGPTTVQSLGCRRARRALLCMWQRMIRLLMRWSTASACWMRITGTATWRITSASERQAAWRWWRAMTCMPGKGGGGDDAQLHLLAEAGCSPVAHAWGWRMGDTRAAPTHLPLLCGLPPCCASVAVTG